EAGGYITAPTGSAPDANLIPVPKEAADAAMDAAACIACGACVAACPNSAAHLFTAAKLQHLNLLPQGQAERYQRTVAMVETMEEYFGSCTMHGECQEACPREISVDFMAHMNRDFAKAQLKNRRLAGQARAGGPTHLHHRPRGGAAGPVRAPGVARGVGMRETDPPVGRTSRGTALSDAATRALDVAVAGVALAVTAPLMGAIAVAVRLTMGSPVLFRQQRAGRGGTPFELVKFRTMRDPRPGEDDGPDSDE